MKKIERFPPLAKPLAENKLLTAVFARQMQLINRSRKTKIFADRVFGRKPPRPWEKYSPQMKFYLRVMWDTNHITAKLDTLEHCIAFLNSYPKTKLWRKNFLRTDYIRYHLEVYYGNLIGTFDRCLLLVNHMYGLGFRDSHTNLYNLIVENENMKGEKVVAVLKQFHKALENIRPTRNFVAHRGNLTDKKLDDIVLFEMFVERGQNFSEKERRFLRMDLRWKFQEYLLSKKKEIKQNNFAMATLTGRVFDAVYPRYQAKIKEE